MKETYHNKFHHSSHSANYMAHRPLRKIHIHAFDPSAVAAPANHSHINGGGATHVSQHATAMIQVSKVITGSTASTCHRVQLSIEYSDARLLVPRIMVQVMPVPSYSHYLVELFG